MGSFKQPELKVALVSWQNVRTRRQWRLLRLCRKDKIRRSNKNFLVKWRILSLCGLVICVIPRLSRHFPSTLGRCLSVKNTLRIVFSALFQTHYFVQGLIWMCAWVCLSREGLCACSLPRSTPTAATIPRPRDRGPVRTRSCCLGMNLDNGCFKSSFKNPNSVVVVLR